MIEGNKTAILLGASGLIGGSLLDILLNSEGYSSVIIFVRKAIDKKHSKLIQHIINFNQLDQYVDLVKCDDLFCCLGTTMKQAKSQEAFRLVDYYYPLKFAEIAKKNGLKHYLIVSSIGANSNSSIFYLRTKGECEDAIKDLDLPSLLVFRPSSLVGIRKVRRPQEKVGEVIMKIFSFCLVGKLRKYRPIRGGQVALAMYRVAQIDNGKYNIYESDQIQAL